MPASSESSLNWELHRIPEDRQCSRLASQLAEPRRHMAPPTPPKSSAKATTPFGCPPPQTAQTERNSTLPHESTREGRNASFLPWAPGEDVTWVGWGQAVAQKCIHILLLTARRAGGRGAQARRHPLPLPARELAQLLLPAAWGPLHWPESLCGGGGKKERTVSDAHCPPPPHPPLFPPTPTPAPPPEQGTRATQAELSSTLLGGSPEAGSPAGAPR